MLLPTKHENLKKNMLVLGADIIRFLKRNGESPVEIVFQYLKLDKEISIDYYFDTVVYLWLADFITLENEKLVLKKKE
ncbi:hypothetical protein HHO38_12000 [Parabacteroides distasonis]|uniref:Uncharacterized protein n=2 Tax=Parabacteroides distasonis TaxID=823 RepID=A0A7L5EI30_PARDI|nr:hypothetical protein [Parabacteroides distasonis]MCC2781884.1 hypothetical protein [Parabacteroides distasonis]MCQ5182739.1 hypothetical protein [Parabacteroides distasonis]QJE28989.1 hypothetical protein HHO38_12000 [Parabacteroides distasonis]WMI42647.1 hypothetical protein Q8809_22315 [Parabacteroides distasonis]WRY44497.1 hypothetical protein P8F78_04645 [Parabacteroides distasonis]